ncbi:MAG: hypothetical protein A2Z91_02830 [Deltaproteobacteria bacterium GWA2_38_16]|nr:MAG: hypothetical protein A2Z91_02830 [Deltaproteobacteria bacterium GWA2_38_16]OGQ02822.1 MAG: hypothetical protein A3D19_06255 [Deltaproteobacteria bacterium RIFCSPHIGHO2_02_FULL_38_15]OGQ34912.1 MAG: hypothetical protein A3A72_00480 [Deltaproteobacteria bacterium RIFCSPLOWO2_01_FULL_38_9]OGQ63764.1 MAG: hypothetical protein A3G92_01250 [Deltaproteobacteria bacterium RIFCSPLOWO2_12_FULL_38_8]HBQ21665.1 hypothetical protein [Deltaproteobacteria bacterium]
MKKFLTALFTFISLSSFAQQNEATVTLPEGFVAPGSFYWTRLYWKGTSDAFNHGKLFTVKEDGSKETHNVWLVVGIKPTVDVAKDLGKTGWELLKTYRTGNVFKDYFKNLGTALWRLPYKTWTHLVHKLTVVKNDAVENYNDIGGSTLVENWGPLGAGVAFLWNNGKTAVQGVWTLGVEFPVELAGRTTWRTLEVVHYTLVPVEPALGTAALWFVFEPINAVRGIPLSVVAGTTGVLLTGVTASMEGTKFLVWDTWHADSKDSTQKAMIRVPANPEIENQLDVAFSTSEDNQQLMEGFEAVIGQFESQHQWIAMSHIVSKLTQTMSVMKETMSTLPESEQAQMAAEYDKLSTLKIVYSIDLERKLFAQQ